jgi:hypothetical protein
MRNLLIFHAILTLLAVVTWYFLQDARASATVVFGSGIALTHSLLQLWHLRRAEKLAGDDAMQNVRIFYRCAFERLAVAVALFAVAFGVLHVAPMPVLSGFIAGHLATVINGVFETTMSK